MIYTLSSRLNFGKYEGELVSSVIREDPDYVVWLLDNVDWFHLSDEAERELDYQLDT